MANIKSAKKRVLTAAKKRARNKTRVSRLRSAVKKYGQADAAKKSGELPKTHSEIDRARAKGVIHRNAAARYKSRLAKKAARSAG
jgi:small subunit ribosomal protein S20